MVTLTLADRRRPLLGKVVPFYSHDRIIRAELQPTKLGEAIIGHWKAFSDYNPKIRPLYLQLMEEHLHGIIQVTEPLANPFGNAIGGFKTWCNKYYRQTVGTADPLFSSGFQDSILFNRGQLERMFNYLRDNPRRLAIRRQFPNLFTTLHHFKRADGTFTAYGNSFLLDKPRFHPLQISRSVTNEELEHARESMLQAVASGSVIVSACISAGGTVAYA